MAYLLYYCAFTLLIISSILYFTRRIWIDNIPSLPGSSHLYSRLPSSFATDIENGLSSSEFDLSGNVAAGDARSGLDDASKRDIQKIIKKKRVDFNEARRIYTEGKFADNNIGPDGLPRDPKFVSFS